VASIHDFGRSHGVTFLVMEFIDGESLAQRLTRAGRLGPDETMRLVAQAAAGLQAVHDQGLVHRDIKPANLLVRRDGAVVITDFGIARHEDASRLTVSGAILGTPTYLSPEQVRGEPAGPRSDVYALGLVAYECLAGERPFVGDNPYAVALQRLQSAPRTIGYALPGPVRAVVERALATDPAGRWPSAAAMADAARAATGTAPARPGPPAAAFVPAAARSVPGAERMVPGAARSVLGAERMVPGAARSVLGAERSMRSSGRISAPSEVARSRGPILLAALAALLLGGSVWAWAGLRDNDGDGRAAIGNPRPSHGSTAPAQGGEPAGFTVCGSAYCPAEPMCWSGLNARNGRPEQPRLVDCATPHYWETFLAIAMPASELTIDTNAPLLERPDVAAACSVAALAERSRNPQATRAWTRDAWPIRVGASTLLHCIASSPKGESTGVVFRPGS
jgi:hypothetical protein